MRSIILTLIKSLHRPYNTGTGKITKECFCFSTESLASSDDSLQPSLLSDRVFAPIIFERFSTCSGQYTVVPSSRLKCSI